MYCVSPNDSCENYVKIDDVCFDSGFNTCLNWGTIFMAIFFAKVIQLIFEASLLFALDVTFTATPLEKLQN